MLHRMKLHSQPFEMIRSGEKTYELRLLDEKRQKLRVDDVIEFTLSGNQKESLYARVSALYTFGSFEELYASLPLLKCGYTEEDVADASPADMEKYYSREEQSKWGVVAIELELLK